MHGTLSLKRIFHKYYTDGRTKVTHIGSGTRLPGLELFPLAAIPFLQRGAFDHLLSSLSYSYFFLLTSATVSCLPKVCRLRGVLTIWLKNFHIKEKADPFSLLAFFPLLSQNKMEQLWSKGEQVDWPLSLGQLSILYYLGTLGRYTISSNNCIF